jgi:hypothetical protein
MSRQKRRSDGRQGGSGFLAMIKEVAKPWPNWTDITDYFTAANRLNIGGYRQNLRPLGAILRRKNHRILVTLMPGVETLKYPPPQKDKP